MERSLEQTSRGRPGRAPLIAGFLLAALALLATGCQVGEAQAKGKKELFELKPSLVRGTAGSGQGSLAASLTIVVAEGYKWNAEYPFRLTIKEQTKTRLAKESFAAADLRVAGDQHSAQIDLGATGTSEGGARILGSVSFSVCDKSVCKVYRNRAVEWRLDADAP